MTTVDGNAVYQRKVVMTMGDGSTTLELSQDGLNLNNLVYEGTKEFVDISGNAKYRIREEDDFIERPVSFNILYELGTDNNTDQLFDEIGIVSGKTCKLDIYKDGEVTGNDHRTLEFWIEYIDIVDQDMILHLDVVGQDAGVMEVGTVA